MKPVFEIFKGSNGQFYFRLRSANREIILASEAYTTKANCLNGVQSVKNHSPFDRNYRKLTARNAQFYFTLVASNGEIIGVSEMYNTESARDNGISAVKRDAPDAETVDLT